MNGGTEMDVREKTSNEKRLIDENAKMIDKYFNKRLVDAHDLWSDIMMLPHNGDMISSEEVIQTIMSAPVVDAVPVIRCRECSKWWQKKDTTWLCRGFGYCTECMMGCHADNYCSYGERKEV